MRKEAKSLTLINKHYGLKKTAKNIVIFLVVAIIVFLISPWQQTAKGVGRVVAFSPNERKQEISAPVSGRLGKWYVEDGSHVDKGDPIIQLSDNDTQIIQRLEAEKTAVQARIKLLKKAADTAKINVRRQKKLFDEGISSQKNYEQANFIYLDYENQVTEAKVELTKINVRIARQESQMVLAPLSGTIINRLAGEQSVIVKQGDYLATLIPDTDFSAVEMWLDGNDIPLVEKGAKVRLQFEGWPAVQFSGWPSVAIGTFGGQVKVIDPADNGAGKFRILVVNDPEDHPWPDSNYLRQGVRTQGWVMLGVVPLWFELWRRFNGFPPSIQRKSKSQEDKMS